MEGFMYYISWSPSLACRCTRCFSSEAEREDFRRRVEGIKGANIRTWEYFPRLIDCQPTGFVRGQKGIV
jgi:hypothetical protein